MYHTSYLHNCFRVVLVPTSTNVSEIHLFFNYCSHAKHSPWQRVEVVLFTVILQTVVSHWKASSLTVAEGQHSLRWVWHSLQKQPFLKLEAVLFQYIRYQRVQKVWTVYCTLLLLNCNWTELQRTQIDSEGHNFFSQSYCSNASKYGLTVVPHLKCARCLL